MKRLLGIFALVSLLGGCVIAPPYWHDHGGYGHGGYGHRYGDGYWRR